MKTTAGPPGPILDVGLGSWAIGGFQWGSQDDRASVEAIHAAVDHGVNWIDTAPIYGSDIPRPCRPRALRELPVSRRPLVFTKFGLGANSDAKRGRANTRWWRNATRALRSPRDQRIDLYQLHWPAPEPIAETAAACDRLLTAGKIRAVGVSGFSGRAARRMARDGTAPAPIRRHAASCVRRSRAMCCRGARRTASARSHSPLFRGMLFGTWAKDKTFPPDDARSTHKDYLGARFQRHLAAIDEVKALATTGGLTCAQLCVGVLLRTPGLTGCIVGARNARQGAAIAGLDVTITEAQAKAVWEIASRLQTDLTSLT
jgi:aryl-alcohol dehydrogenase-like predicted oxidoreductase